MMKNYKFYSIILFSILIFSFFVHKLFYESDNLNIANVDSKINKSASSTNLMANLPLRFIPNKGQAGTEAEYHVQGAGHTVLFHEEKVVLRREESADKRNEIVLEFEGANKNPIIEGKEKLSGVASFYKGSNPDEWQINLPTYSSILYKELYPGIDMGYVGEEGKLESEFYVSANTDYHKIKLNYSGIKSKRIRDDGALVFETELGELIENTPYVYQEIDDKIIEVEAQYAMLDDERIGFELGSYNSDYPVVIDPELIFITVVQAAIDIWGSGVVIDANGDLIIAGAASRFFSATDTISGSNHDGGLGNDGLLLKLDGTSGDVIYSALFGGSSGDYFNDIAIDGTGNIFLTGFTESSDFPIMNAAQATLGGGDDATLTILNSSFELISSSYLGGSGYEYGEGISVDESGNVYVGGKTNSLDFPTLGAFQSELHGLADNFGEYATDLFVTKYNSNGSVSYSTYLGGTGIDRLADIAVNSNGEATISGTSESEDFPLANAYQNSLGGGAAFEGDIVIIRLNSSGDGLIYSTYFGDAAADWAAGISLGADGSTIVAGNTTSLDFPIINGESDGTADESDGVLIMMDNAGQPVYSVRTNITGWDEFVALAVDDSSIAYPVASENSIKVFEKSPTDTLSLAFENEAMGHNINGVYLADGNLAFAATYWGATTNGLRNVALREKNYTISSALLSGAECSAGLLKLKENFKIFISFDELEISFKNGYEGECKIGVNSEGFVTINGISTGILQSDPSWRELVVFGSDGDDNIDLSSYPSGSTVWARKGNDKITGADRAYGEEGDDIIRGTESEDFLHGGFGNDIISGNGGDDNIEGNDGDDIIDGGDGNDFINGNDGDDTIDGGSGNDAIAGGRDKDIIRGSQGNDVILFRPNDLVVDGGDGNDYYNSFGKEVNPPTLNQTNFQNNELAKSNENTITLVDKSGLDTLAFSDHETGIVLDITIFDTEQTIDTSGTQVILQGNFEVLLGTEHDDEITVSPLPDTARYIDGGGGTDILNFESVNVEGTDNGSTITTPGFADITHINFETINLSVTVGIETANKGLPTKFSLENNYPNPFNPSTTIKYSVPFHSSVTLKVFDVIGREVSTLFEGEQLQGNYKEEFDASGLTSGIYFYRVQAGQFVETKKMVLMK